MIYLYDLFRFAIFYVFSPSQVHRRGESRASFFPHSLDSHPNDQVSFLFSDSHPNDQAESESENIVSIAVRKVFAQQRKVFAKQRKVFAIS